MVAQATDKHGWHRFRHDRPGRRFRNQRRRMRTGSRGVMIAQVSLGVLLFAVGVVLLFIPGPGLPFIVFGLALIAGSSKPLANVLDRIEPPIRRVAIGARDRWRASPAIAKVGLGAIAGMVVGAFAFGMYRLWFA